MATPILTWPGVRDTLKTMRRFTLTAPWNRLSLTRSNASTAGLYTPGLAFTSTPGPLLMIVGLCGGAGATTLAYLIAATAARQSRPPVLVCDTGGPTAGLSTYTGVQSPRTLAETSQLLADGLPCGGELFVEAERRLRVIAGAPQFTLTGDAEAIHHILRDARDAHALTVIDGGTLSRTAEHAALAVATHVAWMLPASESALTRARCTLGRIAPLGRPEIIIARGERGNPPMRALKELADSRRAPLILMPYLPALSARQPPEVSEEAMLTLQAIGGVLQR